jgi:two-component system chemotaxis response regulator CheY
MARILVVDDSGLSRRMSGAILTGAGHQIVEAEDGSTAIEKFYLEKPDLVLLDMTMKGMNGLDTLKKLREMDPNARVVIATADIQSSTRQLTDEAGAVGFITKPFVADEMIQAVATALKG